MGRKGAPLENRVARLHSRYGDANAMTDALCHKGRPEPRSGNTSNVLPASARSRPVHRPGTSRMK